MLDDFAVIDLFCGIGGLTHGLKKKGFNVVAGIDVDKSCEYAYEKNNKPSKFYPLNVFELPPQRLESLFPFDKKKILVGCAPCQPFSLYNKKRKNLDTLQQDDNKWKLLEVFADLIVKTKPMIVSMENVMSLKIFKKGAILKEFRDTLEDAGYKVSVYDVNAQDYGTPQRRKRLVLFGTLKDKPVKLIPPTHKKIVTVRKALKGVPPIKSGEICPTDPLHRCRKLGELNMRRIKATREGGFWREWPEELKLECHKKEKGRSFRSVYGRMSWEDVAPTMTTYCVGLGNGRFGHPEQDRAISLREAAIFQDFPRNYDFINPTIKFSTANIARQIGNAVPVGLGKVIGQSIINHLMEYGEIK